MQRTSDRRDHGSGASPRPRLDPAGFHRRIPLTPERMLARITPTRDMIVLCHLGVPRLDAAHWSLTVDGLVERPLQLGLADLARFPARRLEAVHQCAGSPLAPRQPTRRASNVVWSGVGLADVLAECRPLAAATHLWSEGADWGAFEGVTIDAYQKDLPLARALAPDTLIATAVNGAPLPAENGFPARLVVPGYFGTNSVKWLTRITLADRRADGAFVTRWYNDPVLDEGGRDTGATQPVWSLHPEALIVAPAPGERLPAGRPVTIAGWAWADRPLARVEVRTGDGEPWQRAELEARHERAWQAFRIAWTPARPGPVTLAVRATDADANTQPETGWRNAVHTVGVDVS